MSDNYDFIVIGGGIFGCWAALTIADAGYTVALLEKENTLMMRASCHNQARIHNGYHYPRSLFTASHSHNNYQKFVRDFSLATCDFEHIYAIPNSLSRVNSSQYEKVCEKLELPLLPLSDMEIKNFFNVNTIEKAFWAEESAFNANILRSYLYKNIIKSNNISLLLSTECKRFNTVDHKIVCELDSSYIYATKGLLNITYAEINKLLSNSGFSSLPIQFEFTEICLVSVPDKFSHYGITVMDGPFFSCIPFPAENCYSLTHVVHTPIIATTQLDKLPDLHENRVSRFLLMKKDAMRFMPLFADVEYIHSFFEIKAIPLYHEHDDARPILFVKQQESPIIASVLGAKIDCYYDLIQDIKKMLDKC